MQAAIDEAIEVHRHIYGRKFIAEDLLLRIENCNNRVTTLRAERNKISHFCWCRTNDESVFGTNFAGGVPSERWERKNSRQVSLADLRKLYTEAHEITEEMMLIVRLVKPVDETAA